ncbi:MAG: DUF502 domain-containing protein [Candidatus Bipolaricaulota bacterium]
MKRLMRLLRDTFVSGLLVILPAGLTAYVLWLIFRLVASWVGPQTALSQLLTRAFGRYIPGTEILVTVGVVLVVGAVARYWLGKRLVGTMEQGLLSLPVLRKLYSATRQLSYALLKREVVPGAQVKRLVLVEFPKEGSYVMGFLTSNKLARLDKAFGKRVVSVYVPTAPNPLSGYVLFLPEDKLVPLDLTIDEGFSLLLSGGVVVPERLRVEQPPKEVPDADQAG